MVVTEYVGDETVVEYVAEPVDTEAMLAEAEAIYQAALHRYDAMALEDEYPFGDPDQFEEQVLAWREADGITYDRLEDTRARLIDAAMRRGDIAALAILGVGGRRFG